MIEAEEEKLEIKEKTLPAGQLAADRCEEQSSNPKLPSKFQIKFFSVFRYGLVPLPGQVEKVEKVVAATQVQIMNTKCK